MSRAFTKEIDDAPPPPPEERTMSAAPNFVTPRGARLIAEEIAALDAQVATASGAQLAALQRDLRYWSARQATMQLVPPADAPSSVGFGTTIKIRRNGRVVSLSIVGEDEADPATGRIAWTSPLAEALEGAEAGETVPFEAGGRDEDITVLEIGANRDA